MDRSQHPRLIGKRVLVTGASGFLGAHLCHHLHEVGAHVLGVSRRHRSDPAHVSWTTNDLTSCESVVRAFQEARPEVVYHLAGSAHAAPRLDLVEPTFESIVVSTKNVLIAAAESGRPRVILIGSLEEPLDDLSAPASPYAAAKYAAGAYGRMFNALYDVPVVNLRVFMTYGPGQLRTKIVPCVITSLLQERPPELSSGRRPVDWIYVDDVIEGLVTAATATGVEGATLDLGSGTLVTIRDAVETIARIIRPAVSPLFGALADRPGETTRAADVATTARLIGWHPRTTLEDGLARTVAWYREQLAAEAEGQPLPAGETQPGKAPIPRRRS